MLCSGSFLHLEFRACLNTRYSRIALWEADRFGRFFKVHDLARGNDIGDRVGATGFKCPLHFKWDPHHKHD